VVQHRRIFTTMATRSRVFLTNYDRFGHRRHAGAHREVGPRFYEAMAAGCALAGDLPVSSRQSASTWRSAAAAVPSDAVRLPSDLAAVLDDPAESERLGRIARVAALRRNDVAHAAGDAELPRSRSPQDRGQDQAAGRVAETIAAGAPSFRRAASRLSPIPPRQRDWRDETDPGGQPVGYRDPAFDRSRAMSER